MKAFHVSRWSIPGLLVVALAVSVVILGASGPVAVYALVDKVVFEPNETAPERIQIWGAFSLEVERYGTNYLPAQKGYLYYKIDKSNSGIEQGTRSAWADLKRVAGTGQAVGFGGGYAAYGTGTVRKAADKPASPDAFPIGNPVVSLGASQADVVGQLKAVLQTK